MGGMFKRNTKKKEIRKKIKVASKQTDTRIGYKSISKEEK